MKCLSLLGLIFVLFSCNKEQVIEMKTNDKTTSVDEVIVDREKYRDSSSAYFSIDTVKIDGDIMTITIGASGCSGDSWSVELIDSEMILKSYPGQRSLKVLFKNEELCQAYFLKEYSFNISKLKLGEAGKVYLNLENYKERLLYEY